MYISPPKLHHTGLMNIQEWLLLTVICPACRVHEGYVERGEKEQQLIEVLPASHFLKTEPVPEKVRIEIHMTAYDIEKMRQLKMRMQWVKDIFTTYTPLSANRSACVQSQLPSAPYTITALCLLQKNKSYRDVSWQQPITPLEEMYIRWYQVFSALCTRRHKTMSTSPLGIWQPLLIDEKKNAYMKKMIHQGTMNK